MQQPKTELQILIEDVPRIALGTSIIGIVGGFTLALGGWLFFNLLALVFGL